eukprot:TRINITY_DN4488_c0_g1_i1.p1 TRINITY_DN4488_c0_g1~~TRINITY_DN4488_c0_g1_i1.p1  ORF type:complete len:849 (+),score=260.74 TRINITY_DN4488_c0_g1_i1:27-2573(+)
MAAGSNGDGSRVASFFRPRQAGQAKLPQRAAAAAAADPAPSRRPSSSGPRSARSGGSSSSSAKATAQADSASASRRSPASADRPVNQHLLGGSKSDSGLRSVGRSAAIDNAAEHAPVVRVWTMRRSKQPQPTASSPKASCAAGRRRPAEERPRRQVGEVCGLSYRFGEPEAAETVEELQQALAKAGEEELEIRETLRALEHELAMIGGTDSEDYAHRKARLKSRAEGAAKEVTSLRRQREAIMRGDDNEVRLEHQKRQELMQFGTASGFTTEEQIQDRIIELERQMWERNPSLPEEKRMLGEISALRQEREEVRAHLQLKASLRDDSQILRKRLQEVSSQLKAKIQEAREADEELEALIEERERAIALAPEQTERAVVHRKLTECQQVTTRLQEKLRVKERIQAAQRAHEEWARRVEAERQDPQRLDEQERKIEERKLEEKKLEEKKRQEGEVQRLREAEARRKAAASRHCVKELPQEPPHFAEVRLLEQTLAYCRTLLPKELNSEAISFSSRPPARSEEYLFAPLKPRRHEGKVHKRPQTSKLKRTRTEGEQVIMHTPLSFRLFEELQMTAPANTAEVPDTVAEVQRRLAALKEQIADWEAKRKELLEQKLAAELEKARLQQEERDREHEHRLAVMLKKLKEQVKEHQGEHTEAGVLPEKKLSALKAAMTAAANAGAGAASLAEARAVVARAELQEAQACLAQRAAALEAHLEEQARLDAEEESAGKDGKRPSSVSEEDLLVEDTSRQSFQAKKESGLRRALKALDVALTSARKAGAEEPAIEFAQGLLQKAEDALAPKTMEIEVVEKTAEPLTQEQESQRAEDDFVPVILNLDDDDEELVFDLGMG